MILETLDVKKNDIFIYSLNRFSMENNFKLINKDARVKYPKSIHFNDVCHYINDGRPKNLILYRLLTNIPDFDPQYIKYGLMINVDDQKEVLFFDPAFAVKELEDYSNVDAYPNLRFRIQQVGLISLVRRFGEGSFHEVYAFDLEATEVRWQNDRVFAEIIFAFDEIYLDEEDKVLPNEQNRAISPRKFVSITSEQTAQEMIEEDQAPQLSQLKRLKAKPIQTLEKQQRPVSPQKRMTDATERRYSDNSFTVNHIDILNIPRHSPIPVRSTGESPTDLKSRSDEQNILHRESQEERNKPFTPDKNETPQKPVQKTPRATPLQNSEHTVQKPEKKTFSSFLKNAKKELNSGSESDTGDDKKRHQVIDIFKTSASIQDFMIERGKKQVVLKLKNR